MSDCETGKGRPHNWGGSSENLQVNYPFHILATDHIPSLPRSFEVNEELFLWGDLFSGYAIARRARPGLHKRSRKAMKNVYFEDSVRYPP